MATNFYFNNFTNSQEQGLIENLIIESIKIYGHDVYYVPRTINARDNLYEQDDLSTFEDAYLVEMYVKNVEGFDGEGDLFSRFGVEIRDQITFVISQRVFDEEISVQNTSHVRPKEGDLVFLPLNNKAFEIKFVEHEAVFYQMGSLQTYELTCELYEYSEERFNTGIEIIDKIERDNAQSRNLYVTDTVGTFVKDETITQLISGSNYLRADILTITANTDAAANNAYTLEVNNIRADNGTTKFFANNITITGVTSSATATLGSRTSENLDVEAQNDFFETEADNFLDFSEQDPFSEGGTF